MGEADLWPVDPVGYNGILVVNPNGRVDGGNSLFSSGIGIWVLATLAVASLALIGVVLVLVLQQRIVRQYRRWMTGTSGGSLEAILTAHVARVQDTSSHVDRLAGQVQELMQVGRLSLQHAAIVRYNPFHDTGSDQSFALVLADALGNGIVLSSLHARDATRVYGKPLVAWESAYTLADEEREAISRAKGSHLQR